MVGAPEERLQRRYVRLGLGELAAAAVFAATAVGVAIPRFDGSHAAAALWSALVPLLVVLIQAGVYWLLARSWVGRAPMPVAVATVYRVFRVLDAVVLGVGLLGVLTWLPDHRGAAVFIVALWVFGVVEYANYFVVRLAYPLRRWLFMVGRWRTPRLVLDLNSACDNSFG